ncbi:MAG: HDOD domain-containing protein [Pseudomonadota bacterium]
MSVGKGPNSAEQDSAITFDLPIPYTLLAKKQLSERNDVRQAYWYPHPAEATPVVIIQLEDSMGRTNVLIRKDTFLDLTRLCELVGRNFQARQVLNAHPSKPSESLNILPFPNTKSESPTALIIDHRVIETDKLLVATDHPDFDLIIETQDLISGLGGSVTMNVSEPIHPHDPNNQTIIALDKHILSAVHRFTALRIKQRLEETLEIPPFPETARRLIELRLDPDASVADLAEIVETDPSLAAQVVFWASSSYYSAAGSVKSVHDAVVRVLGFDLVMNLALGLSMGKALNIPKDCIAPYWEQSVFAATLAQALAQSMEPLNRPHVGLSYLAGLLHNFGYLLMAHIFPPHFSQINRFIECNPHAPHSVIEHYLVGITREQLSARLFAGWNLPHEVVHAIQWQNTRVYRGEHMNYARLLYITNQFLRLFQISNDPLDALDKRVFVPLGLTYEQTEKVAAVLLGRKEELRRLAQQLNKA